jgi:hypothetical protein
MIRGSRVLSNRKWIHLTHKPGLCQHHICPIPKDCRLGLWISDRNLTAVRLKYWLEEVRLAQASFGVFRFYLPAQFHESSVSGSLSCGWWTVAHFNAAISHKYRFTQQKTKKNIYKSSTFNHDSTKIVSVSNPELRHSRQVYTNSSMLPKAVDCNLPGNMIA